MKWWYQCLAVRQIRWPLDHSTSLLEYSAERFTSTSPSSRSTHLRKVGARSQDRRRTRIYLSFFEYIPVQLLQFLSYA